MHIHPDVARLRKTLPAQPLADAALVWWRGRADVAAAIAGLGHYGAGAALADVPALARLLGDRQAAENLAGGLFDALAEALRAEPLAQLPLGHSCAPGFARLRLACHGRAGLSLVAYAPRGRVMPVSALFEDGEAHEIVIVGAGEALVHRREGAGLVSRTVALTPGTRLARRGVDDARQIIAVTRPLLVLQLTREAARPLPSREIALADGRLVKTISGCKQTSQHMMALAVLGALRHAPAVPVLAGLAQDHGADRDLRWEALRQCLALDARQGLEVLAALAGDPGDALRPPAEALQARLAAACPGLAPLLAEPA